jgi:ComEC/Rec2-related protein
MLAYALFAGLTPSVLRAAAMWGVMMAGLAAARRYDPISSLSAAAVAILAVNPLDLFDAGFQLSFAATAAIFLWYAPLSKHAPRNKALKFFFDSAGLTVCATVMALPIILSCFNQISPVSPLANLLLVPASFIMQLGGTALVFTGFIPGAAGVLGEALNWYVSLYLRNVSMLTWTSAPLHAATPALWLSALFALAALLVSPAVVRMAKPGRIAAAVALAVSAALMLAPASEAFTWRSEAAAVAEGNSSLSVWWRAAGRDYAACGQDWEELAAYLRSRGVSRLAGLYVLRASPPEDGSMLLKADGVSADRLYVPEAWLSDPKAETFLGQGIVLGMEPAAAESGPFAFERQGGSAALTIPAGGGALAFVPWASARDFARLLPRLETADAILLNVPASRAAKLPGFAKLHRIILPGEVAGLGVPAYNSTACGSIEVERRGAEIALIPWREGWADGIQGNFR